MKNLSKIVFGGLLSSMVLVGCESAPGKNEKKELKPIVVKMEKDGVIQNNHEWDSLTEVVIGRWVEGSFVVPEVKPELKEFFPYISEEAWTYFEPAVGKSVNEVYPDDDAMYHQEQEDFVALVESLGIKVHRPDELAYSAVGTSQCYSRDPIVTIGNKVIITNMYSETRRKETSNYSRIAQMLVVKYQGKVVKMPALKQGFPEENAYLEGGDVFVDGKNIYVGMSGNATNMNGVEWLKNELGSDYTVHVIKLKHHVLHLDCAMMLINEKQGVICKEDFVDFESAPEGLKNREWVNASPEDAQRMATNGMVVNPKTVIMLDAFPDVVKGVENMGIKVYTVPFKKGDYFGGGLRCSYQPIHRM